MKALVATALAVFGTFAATAQTSRPPVEHIGRPMLGTQRLPFSDAVRVGDILFLSGQVGLRPDGTVPEGFEPQVRLMMDNIGGVLKSQGLGWGDVVKCTVMLDNISDWPAFNRIYVSYFPKDRPMPARSAFGADGLALGALVELECWAYAGKR